MTQVFSCPEVDRFGDAYVDGEFADGDRRALDEHLAACPGCAAEVKRRLALKRALRASLPRPRAPAGLQDRLRLALAAEVARRRRWRRGAAAAVAVAAAAAAGLVFMVTSRPATSPVVSEAIARHQRDLPLEVAGGDEQVRAWFAQKVDFSVRPPRMPANAALRGARLANIRERQAAYLVYDIDGRRVSVFVFDPGDLPLEAARRQRIGDRQVFLDGQRGYHVALFRDRGMGYAIASDLDEDRMLQLVSSAISR